MNQDKRSDKEFIVGVLSKVPPFSSLRREKLYHVADIVEIESYSAGDRLFSFGERGDKLYVIAEGKVRVGRQIPGMGEEAFAILGPGSYFGELSLIDEGPRSADAIIHETCTLLSISHAEFEEFLMLNQQIAYEILWEFCRILSERLRQTNEKLTMLQSASKF